MPMSCKVVYMDGPSTRGAGAQWAQGGPGGMKGEKAGSCLPWPNFNTVFKIAYFLHVVALALAWLAR